MVIGKRDRAMRGFEICREIDSRNYRFYTQLFLEEIQREDYENIFQCFDFMFQTMNDYHKPDNFLYF